MQNWNSIQLSITFPSSFEMCSVHTCNRYCKWLKFDKYLMCIKITFSTHCNKCDSLLTKVHHFQLAGIAMPTYTNSTIFNQTVKNTNFQVNEAIFTLWGYYEHWLERTRFLLQLPSSTRILSWWWKFSGIFSQLLNGTFRYSMNLGTLNESQTSAKRAHW